MNKSTPEEDELNSVVVDLEYIARKTSRKIGSLFSWLGNALIALFLAWKTLLLSALIGGILGAASLLFLPRQYESSIVLKSHIDAKDQLFNDVNYLNTLIESDKRSRLSEILGLTLDETAKISSVEINPFSNINDRLNELNKTYDDLDSNLKKSMDVEQLLANDAYSFTNKFKVTIYAKDPFVFENIEVSLLKFLERVPQLNKLRNNEIAILQIQKKQYKKEIDGLDSLKSILNNVLIEQAKASKGEMTINLGQSNQSESFNPLKIYRQVEEYTQNITEIEEQLPLYEQCYFVVSHLNQTGQKTTFSGFIRAVIGALVFAIIAAFIIIAKPVKR